MNAIKFYCVFQLIDQRENGHTSTNATHRNRVRRRSAEARNTHRGRGRKSEDEDDEDDHFNLNLFAQHQNRREECSDSRPPCAQPRHPFYGHISDEIDQLASGVNNPIYGHISEACEPQIREVDRRPDVHAGNSRSNRGAMSYEASHPSDRNGLVMDHVPNFLMDHHDFTDSRHQYHRNGDEVPWTSSNPQAPDLYQPPSTDLLNNQVIIFLIKLLILRLIVIY